MLRHTCFVTQTLEADPDCLDRRGLCDYGCVVVEREAMDLSDDPDSAPDDTIGGEMIVLDPESNWDICPVCLPWLAEQDGFPGTLAMRAHHQAHRGAAEQVMNPKGVVE